MKDIVIAAFYKFVPLIDFEELRLPLLKVMQDLSIKGTIILAAEGINGSFAGARANMNLFYAHLRQDTRFVDLQFKESFDSKNPFEKTKVKLRKEIVSLGVENIDPLSQAGTYLQGDAWNELLEDPEVLVIDTRNDYEYALGTFKNAINPNTENFRNFPDYVQQELMDKKDKKIAMFCTGGIRCEKSTAYLRSLGFENVYHLEGGILNYIENTPRAHSLWEGSCFVFDNRVAINSQLERVQPQLPFDYKHDHAKEKRSES